VFRSQLKLKFAQTMANDVFGKGGREQLEARQLTSLLSRLSSLSERRTKRGTHFVDQERMMKLFMDEWSDSKERYARFVV
jgi:hypothetical protein